jgi:hypothetical protein
MSPCASGPLAPVDPIDTLADFTATRRMIPVTGLTIGIGVASGYVARLLLELSA